MNHTPSPTDQAADWLTERLANGPVPRAAIAKEATAAGITKTTLARAATRLNITSTVIPDQYPRRTLWRLP